MFGDYFLPFLVGFCFEVFGAFFVPFFQGIAPETVVEEVGFVVDDGEGFGVDVDFFAVGHGVGAPATVGWFKSFGVF